MLQKYAVMIGSSAGLAIGFRSTWQDKIQFGGEQEAKRGAERGNVVKYVNQGMGRRPRAVERLDICTLSLNNYPAIAVDHRPP